MIPIHCLANFLPGVGESLGQTKHSSASFYDTRHLFENVSLKEFTLGILRTCNKHNWPISHKPYVCDKDFKQQLLLVLPRQKLVRKFELPKGTR